MIGKIVKTIVIAEIISAVVSGAFICGYCQGRTDMAEHIAIEAKFRELVKKAEEIKESAKTKEES